MDTDSPTPARKVGRQRKGASVDGDALDSGHRRGQGGPRRYKEGFVDGEYQDAYIRGLVCVFGKRGSGKTTLAKQRVLGARRVVVFDPMACCGDLGFTVVHQPGQLRKLLAVAGATGSIHVTYQPREGDVIAHWENFAALALAAKNLIIVCDEVDMVCSAGSPISARSNYWHENRRTGGLETIVQYGRHSHVAFLGIARAPQDVWRRLTGQCSEMIVFRMNERLELDAVQGRLGEKATRELPNLGQYEYLDWRDDGTIERLGGKA